MTESSGVGAFVPLFQTGLWVLLIVGVGVALRKHVSPMIAASAPESNEVAQLRPGHLSLAKICGSSS